MRDFFQFQDRCNPNICLDPSSIGYAWSFSRFHLQSFRGFCRGICTTGRNFYRLLSKRHMMGQHRTLSYRTLTNLTDPYLGRSSDSRCGCCSTNYGSDSILAEQGSFDNYFGLARNKIYNLGGTVGICWSENFKKIHSNTNRPSIRSPVSLLTVDPLCISGRWFFWGLQLNTLPLSNHPWAIAVLRHGKMPLYF